MGNIIVRDMESAECAYARVEAEIDAVAATDLATINVDIVSATSIVLGVAERIQTFRHRMAQLPEFDVRNVDNLVDYAKAAWYVHVSNLPEPEPGDARALIKEAGALRSKMMMWAEPLVGAGIFDQVAYDRIREGSGNKDLPSDVVALVGLYRSKWDQVKTMCGVTEEDLNRGAEIGPAVFAIVSRRENPASPSGLEGTQRVRRAFTLLDRAYGECRRALQYLLSDQEALDRVAPSLRRNNSGRRAPADPTPETPPVPQPPAPIEPPGAEPGAAPSTGSAASADAAPIGGGAGPFLESRG